MSNVLQGKSNVDATIRERVLQAISDLGYQANAGARSMRQRPKVLGIVVGDLTNPYHAELAAHIERYAAKRMHSILLVSTGGLPDAESKRVRTLIEHRVAAVLFLSSPESETLRMIGADLPKVFVGLTMPGQNSVSVNDYLGAQLAVRHLTALGHREIGFVSAMLADEPRIEEVRFQGFSSGMAEAGLRLCETHLLREKGRALGDGDYQDLIMRLLAREGRPTAIVAALDRIALEVISAADRLGIQIPNELSLIGFDDIAISGHSRIALTTIAQPMEELARLAVDMAVDGISIDGNGMRLAEVMLPPRLIERHTTGRCKD
ncbi:LacI family transcriptional regulator (plasmid) [Rhizobium sp. YTU87027]